VETVEEEAENGHLRNAELWLFTDNSTAESCFVRGSSTSKLLHNLVLRLRKVELKAGMTLHVVHVAGTRMIEQGTDGCSRGSLMEGVLAVREMLDFVNLAETAFERHPPLLTWVQMWTQNSKLKVLKPEEWFQEAHGITGGARNGDGIWIPSHAPKWQVYLWGPPPVIADAALEEMLKAIQKRQDAYYVFCVPRLYTPKWRRLFFKACDFHFSLPAGSDL